MLGVEGETWLKETVNLRTRLDQETLPNGLTYSDMCQLLRITPPNQESTIPVRPVAIRLGETVQVSKDLIAGCRVRNFHGAESSGIWSSAVDASLQFKLEQPARELMVRIAFFAAYSEDQGPQDVQITVNGQSIFSGSTRDWNLFVGTGKISLFPATNSLFIRVLCKYTARPHDINGSGDMRDLGVFISTIECMAAHSDTKPINSLEVA